MQGYSEFHWTIYSSYFQHGEDFLFSLEVVFSTQEFFLFSQELFHFTQEILPLLPTKLRRPYSRNLRVPKYNIGYNLKVPPSYAKTAKIDLNRIDMNNIIF